LKLLLTLDFPPERGGIQRYLFEKVIHTYGPGDSIMVGTGTRGKDTACRAPAVAASLPCPVSIHVNPLSLFNKKWSIVNFLFKVPGDPETVIECGNIYAGIAPWLLSFFRPVRYRVFTYGGELLCLQKQGNPIKKVLFRALLKRAEMIYALGNYGQQLLRDAGIKTPITIDPPRITLPQGSPPAKDFSRGPGTLGLLSVGRFVPHKGHAVLLKAVSLLPPDISWHLVLAGSGPEEKNLRMISETLKLSPRVDFKTTLDDKHLFIEYHDADVFVLPSLKTASGTEGFGIVLLEAAAEEAAIVASRTGGISEVLDNGSCGMLVEPGNPEALAGAILSLARNAGLRKQLAALAYARVREHYAW